MKTNYERLKQEFGYAFYHVALASEGVLDQLTENRVNQATLSFLEEGLIEQIRLVQEMQRAKRHLKLVKS